MVKKNNLKRRRNSVENKFMIRKLFLLIFIGIFVFVVLGKSVEGATGHGQMYKATRIANTESGWIRYDNGENWGDCPDDKFIFRVKVESGKRYINCREYEFSPTTSNLIYSTYTLQTREDPCPENKALVGLQYSTGLAKCARIYADFRSVTPPINSVSAFRNGEGSVNIGSSSTVDADELVIQVSAGTDVFPTGQSICAEKAKYRCGFGASSNNIYHYDSCGGVFMTAVESCSGTTPTCGNVGDYSAECKCTATSCGNGYECSSGECVQLVCTDYDDANGGAPSNRDATTTNPNYAIYGSTRINDTCVGASAGRIIEAYCPSANVAPGHLSVLCPTDRPHCKENFVGKMAACVQCLIDSNCPSDANDCTTDSCSSNSCTYLLKAQGTSCAGGTGTCTNGACVATTPTCTDADGDGWNTTASCNSGGIYFDCNDEPPPGLGTNYNPGKTDICYNCRADPGDTSCASSGGGNWCDGRNCADSNPCTDDSCNEGADRCDNIVNTANICDDGRFCTVSDYCPSSGVCTGTQRTCESGQSCDETNNECRIVSSVCATDLDGDGYGDPADIDCGNEEKDCDDNTADDPGSSCPTDVNNCNSGHVNCAICKNPGIAESCDPVDPDPTGECTLEWGEEVWLTQMSNNCQLITGTDDLNVREACCEVAHSSDDRSCSWNSGTKACNPDPFELDGQTCTTETTSFACDGSKSSATLEYTISPASCWTSDQINCNSEGLCSKQVVCPQIVPLDFFSWINFIISLAVIAGIYTLIVLRKR